MKALRDARERIERHDAAAYTAQGGCMEYWREARESVTRRWTHAARDEVRDARRGYVRHSWADECREMLKLVVPRVGSPRKVGGG